MNPRSAHRRAIGAGSEKHGFVVCGRHRKPRLFSRISKDAAAGVARRRQFRLRSGLAKYIQYIVFIDYINLGMTRARQRSRTNEEKNSNEQSVFANAAAVLCLSLGAGAAAGHEIGKKMK
ncbi:MAG: hypothetical protein AABZ67_05535 [Pseudomonadota bacterium]